MQIINLASGSKGNSTLVEYNETRILIDAGICEKKLKSTLNEVGNDLSKINAICVTHEHIDHIRALSALAKKTDIDFYVHEKLASSPALKEIDFKEGKLHIFSNNKFVIGELEIQPFDISHDAVAPVGFVVNVCGSKSKVGFATDLGVVFESVKQALAGVKMVFLESNYDEKMLWGGSYPYLIKKRIDGAKGHLSNVQSLELAKWLFEQGTKCFVLSHISENNNTYELAYVNYVDYFESQHLMLDKDVFIRLSFQNKHGNKFSLKEDF